MKVIFAPGLSLPRGFWVLGLHKGGLMFLLMSVSVDCTPLTPPPPTPTPPPRSQQKPCFCTQLHWRVPARASDLLSLTPLSLWAMSVKRAGASVAELQFQNGYRTPVPDTCCVMAESCPVGFCASVDIQTFQTKHTPVSKHFQSYLPHWPIISNLPPKVSHNSQVPGCFFFFSFFSSLCQQSATKLG